MKRGVIMLALGVSIVSCPTGCGLFRTATVAEADDIPGETVLSEYELAQLAEQRLLDRADAAKESGDYDTAMALFREILAENPTLSTAYVGIGEIYVLQNDYASAEPAFARGARLEPRNFDAQYGHGLALQMLNRLVEAVKAYHRALTIRPRSIKANLNLATTYLQLSKPSSALTFAEKAVELDPPNGPARANLGAVYEKIGRYADAITQYEAAIELMEPTPPLLMNLINVLAKEKRYVDAKNTAEFLVRIDPTANAYERLGWCYFRVGDYDNSIDAYRKAVEIDPTHWPSLNGIGVNALNTWMLSDKQDAAAAREAKQAFQQSLLANPDQPKVIGLLAHYQF